jgi:hypothetical protein
MSLRWCRWLLPAALAAACGVVLALWSHGIDLSELAGSPANSKRMRADAPSSPPGTAEALARPELPSTPDLETADPQAPDPKTSDPRTADPQTPDQLERLRRDLIGGLGRDLDAVLGRLLALDGRQRTYLAEDVIRRAADRAPERTLQWLEHNVTDPGLREQLLTAAYAGLVRHDPSFAMNLAETLTHPLSRRVARHQVLEAWAAEDAVAAYEWARGRQGEGADELRVMVMLTYIEQAPRQAGDLIAALPAGVVRDRLIDHYAYTLAESDVAAARDWVAQFPAGVASQNAMSSIFGQWAEQDPWAAFDYAAQNVDGELGFELIGTVAAKVGASRPEALSTQLHRLPEAYRPLVAQRLADAWSTARPDAARQWVDSLPAGEVRDSARRGLRGEGRS